VELFHAFPLTPALSRRERAGVRENGRLDRSSTEFHKELVLLLSVRTRLLKRVVGEGRRVSSPAKWKRKPLRHP
jgi:hypothetical protein